VVFTISDNSIGNRNYIYEDLNSLLNIGDIPNLLAKEELSQEKEKLRSLAKRAGIENT